LIFLIYDLRPAKTNPLRATVGGAFVSCWIDTDSKIEAKQRTIEAIDRAGWTIRKLDTIGVVDTSKFLYSRTAARYIAQAEIDGEVFVFHQYERTQKK
jgi:hypothetical protein